MALVENWTGMLKLVMSLHVAIRKTMYYNY